MAHSVGDDEMTRCDDPMEKILGYAKQEDETQLPDLGEGTYEAFLVAQQEETDTLSAMMNAQ
eukprot:3483745-Pyramimonas_sp.AAC.1